MAKIQLAVGVNQGQVPVLPPPVISGRAPTSSDVNYTPGQLWFDKPNGELYVNEGAGIWNTVGEEPATTTSYGVVLLTDNSEPVATKAYADSLAIAGAPVSTQTVAGIGQLATDEEAVAGTPSTSALALFVTPSNLSPVFAAPPAIGGTTPAAGSFTTASVAKTLLVNGGAATDFIGTGTLVAGTATINNTNIAAGDVIILTRTALNATPEVGVLFTTISAGASFTVTSINAAGATANTDVSSFAYFIVRPT